MQPNLLNAILVELQQIDESGTVFDNRRRGTSNVVKRSISFSIQAQIVFVDGEFIEKSKGKNPDERNLAGNVLSTMGYIIVRKIDLDAQNKELKNGDKMISYGTPEKPCELFLIGQKEAAHYTDKGHNTLQKWYFQDRN